jgi:hypothetical protein
MSSYLPDAVRQGLEAARLAAQRRSNRLCLHDGDRVHRVLRLWEGGVALAASDAGPVRGRVDLYDGPRHLATCLIVGVPHEQGEERIYEFKSQTPVMEHPALDFERAEAPPTALIPPTF